MRIRALVVVASTAALLVVAGCTDTTRLPTEERSESPSPSPSDPDYYEDPGATAGRMSLQTFPSLADLGPGWSFTTRSAASEADYEVNSTPAVERDVNEVIGDSIPEGCPQISPIPVPTAALDVRYTYKGRPVTATELEFVSSDRAREFFSLRLEDLRECQGAPAPIGGGVLVGQLIELADGVVLSDRNPDLGRDKWVELSILRQESVVWLEGNGPLGSQPFTSGRSIEIARLFQG